MWIFLLLGLFVVVGFKNNLEKIVNGKDYPIYYGKLN